MTEKVSRQTRSSPGLINLSSWGYRAERFLLSRNSRHWTNSLALWITVNVVDSAITWISLSLGSYEAGPFLRFAAQNYGNDSVILVKMVLALLIGILVWKNGSYRLKGFLNLGMTAIALVNCIFLCRLMWMHNFSL